MYFFFHAHPSSPLPKDSEQRLSRFVRDRFQEDASLRVKVQPDIDGMKAYVELTVGPGLRHRFVARAATGDALLLDIERRISGLLIMLPNRRGAA